MPPNGSTVTIRIRLCDAKNHNLSSSNIKVTALDVNGKSLEDEHNPHDKLIFVFKHANDDDGNTPKGKNNDDNDGYYEFKLETEGLHLNSGKNYLHFKVGNDPVIHQVTIKLE